jgi:hypothetical protein
MPRFQKLTPEQFRKLNAAWQKVLKKWDLITAGKKKDLGSDDCAFCLMMTIGNDCCTFEENIKCPIADFTKSLGCSNTPYIEWINYSEYGQKPLIAKTQGLKEFSGAFRDWLYALHKKWLAHYEPLFKKAKPRPKPKK